MDTLTHTTATTIRDLNDRFRTTLTGGQLMLTPGIVGRPDSEQILAKVVSFSDFSSDNDPYGEHDFGAFEHAGDTIFWKLDYYNHDLSQGSENPANPSVTTRVLTIMLAEEY
jgi:hypothetical protein